MDVSKMKNIVILKDLPSNLIEEAIIVVRDRKKVKKYQYADIEKGKQNNVQKEDKKSDKYIVKEAEMLINTYIKKLETKTPDIKKIQKRYKKSLQVNAFLAFCTIISLILSII